MTGITPFSGRRVSQATHTPYGRRVNDCVFCRIVAGVAPATKVYEDDTLCAFLDIRPIARGHTLVVPKRHATELRGPRSRYRCRTVPRRASTRAGDPARRTGRRRRQPHSQRRHRRLPDRATCAPARGTAQTRRQTPLRRRFPAAPPARARHHRRRDPLRPGSTRLRGRNHHGRNRTRYRPDQHGEGPAPR